MTSDVNADRRGAPSAAGLPGRSGAPRIPRPAVSPAGAEEHSADGGGTPGRRTRTAFGVDRRVLLAVLLPAVIGTLASARWGFPFPPDSRYYIVMTLRDTGMSPAAALTAQHNLTGWIAEPWYFSHTDPVWRMLQPRMLYPFLSAPFVALFGLQVGMLVVPTVSMAGTVVAAARLAQRRAGLLAALVTAGTVSASKAIGGSGLTAALTDSLAVFLIALMMLNLPLGRRCERRHLAWLGVLAALLCLTRQVAPTVVGLTAGGWLWAAAFPAGGARRFRNPWAAPTLVVTVVTGAVQAVGSALAPYDVTQQFLYASNEPSVAHALRDLPQIAWRLARADVATLVQTDRYLLVLLAAPLVLAFLRPKDPAVGVFLGGLAGTFTLTVANGIPSGMRYESVLIPIAVPGMAALVGRVATGRWADADAVPDTRGADALDSAPERTLQVAGRRLPVWAAVAAVGTTAIAGAVGYSARHGSASMVNQVPTSPAAAAALAGTGRARPPVSADPAEATLRFALGEATNAYRRQNSGLLLFTDWRHPTRYRPTGPADPGWADRAADGTAVVRYGDFTEPQVIRFGGALSLDGTVVPDSVRVLSRSRSKYGEDITFTVLDTAHRIHTGHATTVYAVRHGLPSLVTELVYQT